MIRLAVIGMGKMGQTITRLATESGFKVTHEIDNDKQLAHIEKTNVDVAIEFSTPGSAYQNIQTCIDIGIPVVSGTTGWLDQLLSIQEYVKQKNGTFLYASNFSIGMNIVFELNRKLARIMSRFTEFAPHILEIHHTQKLDTPSGTAKTLITDMIADHPSYTDWRLKESSKTRIPGVIQVHAEREGEVFGIHEVNYRSESEEVVIRHEAFDRTIFAKGALMAAQWIINRKGIFTFSDFLNFEESE